MARPVFYDRVLETCSSPGTGTVTLLGSPVGKQTFASKYTDGDRVIICIEDQAGPNWEVINATYSGGTLTRSAGDVRDGSSGAGVLVDFDSGTQNVFGDFDAKSMNKSIGNEVLVYANGLVKNWEPEGFDPDITTYLLIDTTPQDWQPNTEISNEGNGGGTINTPVYVHRVGDSSVVFYAFQNGSAVTGDVEPTWSTDGSTVVDDGTEDRPLTWSPNRIWPGPWAPSTAMSGFIIAAGNTFLSNDGGLTGLTEPDWSTALNNDDTVTDGDITWTNSGPGAVWTPNTRVSFRSTLPTPNGAYTQSFTIPTDAVAGVSYIFIGQPTGSFGTTGATEPDWEDAVSGDGSVWFDNDIMWQESTTNLLGVTLVITGLVAPSTEPTALTIINAVAPGTNSHSVILEDKTLVESDYGSVAVSSIGQQFNSDEQTFEVQTTRFIMLIYRGGEWIPTKEFTE